MPVGAKVPAGPPGPAAFLPDVRAAVADHEARWANGATSSSPAGGFGGHLRPPFDDEMVREAFMPGVREEMRRAVDEKMRPLLAELKARAAIISPTLITSVDLCSCLSWVAMC